MLGRISRWLSGQYAALLPLQAEHQGFPGPVSNLRWYNSFTTFFRNELVYRMCVATGAKRILIVGDGGGRDYWYLRWKGMTDLTVVDIAPQPVPEMLEGDIAGETIPLEPASFDCVVACDVLEHLYDDVKALTNIHRFLRTGGALIVAGPYWHDAERTHVRLHSPEIIRRTLVDTGFAVEEQLARGGLAQVYMRWGHPVNLLLNLLWFGLTGRVVFQRTNKMLFGMNRKIVAWQWLPAVERLLFGMAGGLNGYVIRARKSGDPLPDVKAISRQKFANMEPESIADQR